MKEINKLPEIIQYYGYSIQEVLRIESTHTFYKHMLYCEIDDPTYIYDVLDEKINQCLNNICYEMKILLFMIRNEKKLYENDIDLILDIFEENYEKRYEYLGELCESLNAAIMNHTDEHFYLPNTEIELMNDKEYEKMLSYVKGYNEEELINFLIDEEIIKPEEYDEIRSKCQIIKGDARKHISLFGTYEKAIVVPEITDELSMCINIHEIVNSVLLKMDNIDEEVLESEDIAKFYELLFQNINSFSKENVKPSTRALKLLADYHNEPFKVQVRKISEIK